MHRHVSASIPNPGAPQPAHLLRSSPPLESDLESFERGPEIQCSVYAVAMLK